MDARIMTQSTTSDPSEYQARKAMILSDGTLPNAPMVMPRQMIEAPRGTMESSLGRLLSVVTHSFGLAARGR
jgi:hypothetical protein